MARQQSTPSRARPTNPVGLNHFQVPFQPIASSHKMWGLHRCDSSYMVSIAAGSPPQPGESSQEGTRWKSGTAPQR